MARERSVLVGRDADARLLRELVDGNASLVLLSGDAGIGKSRLLEELLGGVGTRLVGSCLPLQHRISLLPFQEMFSASGVRRAVARAVASLPPGLVQGLAPLLPEEVTPARDSSPAAATPEIERSFAGARALLAAMAASGPLLVAVEDVHWADPASLDLLIFLSAQLRDSAVTVVATFRTDDPDSRTPQMVEWLSHVQHAEGAEQVALERLDRNGTASLMATLLGGPAPAALVDSVHRRAEGNPFFTEQLVAAMARTDDLSTMQLPQRLADFLRGRVRNATTEGARLLEVLALAARPLRVDALVAVTGLDEQVGRRTLRSLVESALVEVGPGDEVRTRHALLNEAVLRELPSTDRTAMHRRLAAALAAEHGDALAAEVAGHWHEGGDRVEELRWTEKAADAAWSVGAYAEAADLLHRVLVLTDEIADGAQLTRAGLVDLWCRAVRAYELAGHTDRSDELAVTAFERFRDWPEPRQRAKLTILFSHLQVLSGEVDRGEALVRGVVEDLELLPPCEEYADALLLHASLFVWQGESRRAVPILERAVAVTEQLRPPAPFVETNARCRLAQAVGAVGDAERSERLLKRAVSRAEASGDPRAGMAAAVDWSDTLIETGRLAEGQRVAVEALDRARRDGLGASFIAHVLVYNATEAALERGLTDAAAALVVDLTDHPLRRDPEVLHELRAEVDLRRGLLADSLAWMAAPLRLWSSVDDLSELVGRFAGILRWAGRSDQALAEAMAEAERACGTDADKQSSLLVAAAGAAADVADAARARRDEGALSSAVRTVARVKELATIFGAGTRHRVQKEGELGEMTAELLRAEGADDPQAWRAAAETWTRLGRPHRAAYCDWRLAQALLDADADRAEVKAALREAFAAADGHAPLRDAVTELADRARIRLVHEAPDLSVATDELPVHLTEQEIRVLGLVAAGMSNAEIGTELFISPKTVSVHVSNLLRKLEVRSRVQAAAWADRVGLVRRE